ncbi:MAG: hypothetical protein VB858_14855 [Planctomycetaceae bacterium]
MKQITTIATAFAAMLTMTLTAQAHSNPDDAAQRCVTQIDTVADRCQEVIADQTLNAVVRIERLLRLGRVEAAIAEARESHAEATATVRFCSGMIDDICEKGVRYLLSVGANTLARRVQNHCDETRDGLLDLLDRQLEFLDDALNG